MKAQQLVGKEYNGVLRLHSALEDTRKAVMSNPDTRERILEAGAMVLGYR